MTGEVLTGGDVTHERHGTELSPEAHERLDNLHYRMSLIAQGFALGMGVADRPAVTAVEKVGGNGDGGQSVEVHRPVWIIGSESYGGQGTNGSGLAHEVAQENSEETAPHRGLAVSPGGNLFSLEMPRTVGPDGEALDYRWRIAHKGRTALEQFVNTDELGPETEEQILLAFISDLEEAKNPKIRDAELIEQRYDPAPNPEKQLRDDLHASMTEIVRGHFGITDDPEATLQFGDSGVYPDDAEHSVLVVKTGFKGYRGMSLLRPWYRIGGGIENGTSKSVGVYEYSLAVDSRGEVVGLKSYQSKNGEESYKNRIIEGSDALAYTVDTHGLDEAAKQELLQQWKNDLQAVYPTNNGTG